MTLQFACPRAVARLLAATLVLSVAMAATLLGAPAAAAEPPPATPNDPLYSTHEWGLPQVRAGAAWATSTGEGAVIAVVDSGIDLGHEDLASQVIPGNTFVNCGDSGCGNGDWESGADEPSSHGTHVAGTAAAATHNGIGVAGVAPGANLLAVKVATSGFLPCLEGAFQDVARGIRWAADNGADVINLSLGHPIPGVSQACQELYTEIHEAVAYANTRDVVTVAAAGNEGFVICSGPPGTAPGAICVTATDRREARAAYSNEPIREDLVAVAAPGGSALPICREDVISTVPAGTAHAASAETCGWGDNLAYEELAGTSMASPHVAGVAALVKSLGCTRPETIDIITATARQPRSDVRGVFTPAFGYGIVDAEAAVLQAKAVCTPAPLNTAPVAGADSAATNEDVPVTIDVLGNDSDADGDALTVASVNDGAKGTVVNNGDGTVTYTPAANLNGPDTFAYRVGDGLAQATGTVSVAITAAPDAPVALEDAAFYSTNTPQRVDVLGNDVDPDGDPLTVGAVTQPGHGATSNGISNVVYTPTVGYDGFDAFTYRVGDGTGRTSTAQVSMFGPACQTKTIFDDVEGDPFARGWTTEIASASVPTTRWFPHNDPAAHSPSQSWVSDAATQGVKDDRLNAPAFRATPATTLTFWHRFLFENGYDGGVMEVSRDGGQTWEDVTAAGGRFVSGGYNGTITPEFDSPIAGRAAWTGSSSGGYPAPPATMSEAVVDLGALAGDTVLVRWRLALDGVSFEPGAGWWVDDVELSGLITDECSAAASNKLPVAVDDAAFTNEGSATTVDLLTNDSDPDGDDVTVIGLGEPAHGAVANNGDGTATYTPDAGFHGTDSFTYTISDSRGGTSSARVEVRVNGAPEATADAAETNEGVPVTFDVLANDVDPEGDRVVVSSFTQPSNGSVTCTAEGDCTYTPRTWFLGDDRFDYEVCDAYAACATAMATVEVTPGSQQVSCAPRGPGWWTAQFDPSRQRKMTQPELDAIAERAADLSQGYFAHRFAVQQAVVNAYTTPLQKAEQQYATLLLNLAAGDLSASMSEQVGLSGDEQLQRSTYPTATVGRNVDQAAMWIRTQLPDGNLAQAADVADGLNNGKGLDCGQVSRR